MRASVACPRASQPYQPPDSAAWLGAWPDTAPTAARLGQAPPPVRKLPPANARVPLAELVLQVPRASATAEMHRCARVGAWPLVLLVCGMLVVLVTSYVVLRVLGFLSWRALGEALARHIPHFTFHIPRAHGPHCMRPRPLSRAMR